MLVMPASFKHAHYLTIPMHLHSPAHPSALMSNNDRRKYGVCFFVYGVIGVAVEVEKFKDYIHMLKI